MDGIKISFPSNEEILYLNKYHKKRTKELVDAGIPNRDQMEQYLTQENIITKQEFETLFNIENGSSFKYRKISLDEDSLNNFVENQILEILLGFRILSENDTQYEIFESLPEDDVYYPLLLKKSKFFKNTCEYIVEKEKKLILTYFCCRDFNTGKRLWPSLEEFLNQRISSETISLGREVSSFLNGINNTILRKIARHPMWRTRWISATKTSTSLFSGNVSDWDQNKLMLCYWSNFYDTIYSGPDRPEDSIIEDDELLDNWLESKNKESNAPDPSKDTHRGIFKVKVNPIKKK